MDPIQSTADGRPPHDNRNSSTGLITPWNHGWSNVPDSILRDRKLVHDHPRYRAMFRSFGMKNLSMLTRTNDVRETLGQVFDARLSFHLRGTLVRDIREFAPEVAPTAPNSMAYMVRYGDGFTRCLIALETPDLHCRVVDKGSVLRAYGHYIEQRTLVGQRMYRAGEMRDSSFMDAYQIVQRRCDWLSPEALPVAADTLISWLNAIWICWLFRLDPRAIIAGMVLDDITSSWAATHFAEDVFPQWQDVLTNRGAAEGIFAQGCSVGFDHCFEEKDVMRLCRQIDAATRKLLATLN
jgi:hypothetical protein